MKKIYQNPHTLIVNVKVQPLMGISGDKVTVSETNYDSDKGSILSRESNSIWDDEE